MRMNRILLCLLTFMLIAFLTACMKGEQTMEKLNVPEEVQVIEEEEQESNETNPDQPVSDKDEAEEDPADTETQEKVKREIYLLDENGLVVPQDLDLPKTEAAAMQAMEYMVVDGPVTELLPNGFQAVLPAGTEILGTNLEEDGTLIVDVSEDFKAYNPDDEVKILQAMTYTLTQFEQVEKIKLWINGRNQLNMPKNGTPLSEGYSRANGINLDVNAKPDLKYSEALTVFYPKTYGEDVHFVPVTTYIDNATDDNFFTSMVTNLMEGPSPTYFTKEVFQDATQLVNKPRLQDGVLQLSFNEGILEDKDKAIISDNVMTTLVKSLTAHEDVDAIEIHVGGVQALRAENGTLYEEPVTADDMTSIEKM